ncbi:hypothetical protein [Bacterioplanoides sp.]|uniref:hypothetical protein n=1 Tax=Bacterioplanoides sp. TaxID=2066072 RepID=UPI003B5AE031
MADKRLKLFPAPAIIQVKQSHPDKFSQRVSTMLDRYQGLLEYNHSSLELSDTEQQQVAECLMGSVVDALFIDCLDQELDDAGYRATAKKIQQTSYADRLVLIESLGCDLALG